MLEDIYLELEEAFNSVESLNDSYMDLNLVKEGGRRVKEANEYALEIEECKLEVKIELEKAKLAWNHIDQIVNVTMVHWLSVKN